MSELGERLERWEEAVAEAKAQAARLREIPEGERDPADVLATVEELRRLARSKPKAEDLRRERRAAVPAAAMSSRGDEHLCAICAKAPGRELDDEGRLLCPSCAKARRFKRRRDGARSRA